MGKKKKKTVRKVEQRHDADRIEWVALDKLHLDTKNPRFGGQFGQLRSEELVLNTIVEKFGVEDVLSSLAVNGFFDAEPLVGIRGKPSGHIRIVEGNRRLAACLILAGDQRAKKHGSRTESSQKLQRRHKQPAISHIPVLVFDESEWRDELLPYLGVRHIAAAQPWDSYAKAAWIAQVLENGDLSLDDVIEMIGDQHRTTPRLLEGFYFVHQLVDEARFRPGDSLRRGRGSNPDYPFSWVYTALGYSPVRRWLGMEDLSEGKSQRPIKRSRLDDAEEFMIYLFGNKSKDRSPAINDSRRIADLAKAVGDPARRQLLKRGKSLDEVMDLTRPAIERVMSGLMDAQDALSGTIVTLGEGQIRSDQARDLLDPSKKVVTLAKDVHRRVSRSYTESEDEEDDE